MHKYKERVCITGRFRFISMVISIYQKEEASSKKHVSINSCQKWKIWKKNSWKKHIFNKKKFDKVLKINSFNQLLENTVVL